MKYWRIRDALYYNTKHLKDDIVYKLINFLIRHTDIHKFKSVKIEHADNQCKGVEYFYIKSRPASVIETNFITKGK